MKIQTARNPQQLPCRTKCALVFLCVVFVIGAALAANSLRGRASFTGQATLTPLGGNQVDIELNAIGPVTHLGKSVVRIHSVADVSGSVPRPIPPSTGIITAANGDTISFTLRWIVEELAPGVFSVGGPLTITGGTGRFEGVTGTGEYTGWLDANTSDCAFAGSYELIP